MSANRLLSLPASQPPYSPRSLQKTDSISQDDSNNTIVSRTQIGQQTVPSSGFDRRTRMISLNRLQHCSPLSAQVE
eukprot:4476979-Pyramimonas_sp.AAC.1